MKADRLLSVLLLMQARGRMTERELAERLEVSQRTVHRDLEAISASGVPVVALRGSQGGWELEKGWRTQVPGLDEAELRALLMAQPRVVGQPAPGRRRRERAQQADGGAAWTDARTGGRHTGTAACRSHGLVADRRRPFHAVGRAGRGRTRTAAGLRLCARRWAAKRANSGSPGPGSQGHDLVPGGARVHRDADVPGIAHVGGDHAGRRIRAAGEVRPCRALGQGYGGVGGQAPAFSGGAGARPVSGANAWSALSDLTGRESGRV